MLKNEDYRLDSHIIFKKPHPSGTQHWKVIRLGADIKVQSTVKHSVFIMMTRAQFNKKVQKVVKY